MLLGGWLDHFTTQIQDSYRGVPPEWNNPTQPLRQARAMLLDSIAAARAQDDEGTHLAKGRAALVVLNKLAENLTFGAAQGRKIKFEVEFLVAYNEAVRLLLELGADYSIKMTEPSS